MTMLQQDGTWRGAYISINSAARAREVTRRYAKTFYFASHALPPEKRDAAYALYAYCRYIDNLVDEAASPDEAARRIARVRRELDDLFSGESPMPRWQFLVGTIHRFGIPKRYLQELVDGVEMDLTPRRVESIQELRQYCYLVASVVGLMMTRVLQPDDTRALPYAADLGTAMQLTNILRDIGEDYAMGRIYLPAEELREFKVAEDVFVTRTISPAFCTYMRFQVSRAREYYRRADAGIALLPNDGSRFCVRLMSSLYSRILDAIETQNFDVFAHRAHVPLVKKVGVAIRTVVGGTSAPYFLLPIDGRQAVRSDVVRRMQRRRQNQGPVHVRGERQ